VEILIDDIPEEGLEIEATEEDPWFSGIMKAAIGDAFRDDDRAHAIVQLVKFEENVTLDGRVNFTSHNACDRCLEEFSASSDRHLHAVLIPARVEKRKKRHETEEVQLVQEDLEFGLYEGDRFDLAEIIKENMVLDEAMVHLCREDCKGLCQRCGRNLNNGSCDCVEKHGDPRWAALRGAKVPPDRHD